MAQDNTAPFAGSSSSTPSMAHPVPASSPSGLIPGVTRKQNIACDQCRSRKIRCLRTDKKDVCEQCKSKSTECTSNYIEALAEKKKKAEEEQPRGSRRKRKRRSNQDQSQSQPPLVPSSSASYPVRSELERHVSIESRDSEASSNPQMDRTPAIGIAPSIAGDGVDLDKLHRVQAAQHVRENASAIADSLHLLTNLRSTQNSSLNLPPPTSLPNHPPPQPPPLLTPGEQQHDLIRYLLSPYPVLTSVLGYSDVASIESCKRGESDLWEEMGGKVWEEGPSEAHKSLAADELTKLADDLIDSFFSVAHIRNPCYDPPTFRARLYTPNTHPQGPIPHPILATALAWGARFSDHPVIQQDRDECSQRRSAGEEHGVQEKGRGRKRSRLVQMAVIRAREVCEICRIWRIPSIDNVKALLNLDGLLGQALVKNNKYQAIYATAAVKHLLSMGYNSTRAILTIPDEKERAVIVLIWCVLIVTDSYRSVYYRIKPCLLDDDYDLEPPRSTASLLNFTPVSHSEPDQSILWFSAARSAASMCRALSLRLCSPHLQTSGIPLSLLRTFIHAASVWRTNYLSKLGVPPLWPESWNFLQAIAACSADVSHHALWLVLYRALEESGVEEETKGAMGMGIGVEVESVKRRIKEESEHAALRIAALVAVLTENEYLSLDPLSIHHPIYEAGLHLAQRGRAECLACVIGLKQYAITFPGTWDNAEELEKIYADSQRGDPRPDSRFQSRTHVSMNGVPDGETASSLTGIGSASAEPATMPSIEEQMWQGEWEGNMWHL
ncbi:hypothetical protein J007_01408 [Cryptococcus neoformans]|nr:hypothetical protein J007_01408 [Cryptococcus neoformans var. grubii]OXC63440.1 hypothetical protein C358_01412 [Cryptococcus neoformans var. grubii MW-RSA852]